MCVPGPSARFSIAAGGNTDRPTDIVDVLPHRVCVCKQWKNTVARLQLSCSFYDVNGAMCVCRLVYTHGMSSAIREWHLEARGNMTHVTFFRAFIASIMVMALVCSPTLRPDSKSSSHIHTFAYCVRRQRRRQLVFNGHARAHTHVVYYCLLPSPKTVANDVVCGCARGLTPSKRQFERSRSQRRRRRLHCNRITGG